MSPDHFVIKSVHGAAMLTFTHTHDRTVLVRLSGERVQAYEQMWVFDTQRWPDFFAAMARDWRGWDGEMSIGSDDEPLRLTCTRDEHGHVLVRVRLQDGGFEGPTWRAEDLLLIESGQLEELSLRAAEFFS